MILLFSYSLSYVATERISLRVHLNMTAENGTLIGLVLHRVYMAFTAFTTAAQLGTIRNVVQPYLSCDEEQAMFRAWTKKDDGFTPNAQRNSLEHFERPVLNRPEFGEDLWGITDRRGPSYRYITYSLLPKIHYIVGNNSLYKYSLSNITIFFASLPTRWACCWTSVHVPIISGSFHGIFTA